MPNEELIYRITRAIYDRFGTAADENIVEQLVTDIYREVEPQLRNGFTSNNATTAQPSGSGGSADRLIVSVFGVDHPGIVAGVSQILADAGCSIVDINQTVVQGKFAMVIIANTSRSSMSVNDLKERFRVEGDQLGVRIHAQREDLFNAMHRV